MSDNTEERAKNRKFVLLHNDDNVLVCSSDCHAGENVDIDGTEACLSKVIEVGHKVARHDLEQNSKIIKCGAPIGSLLASVKCGEHIHSHNLKSDYIASHTRYATGDKL